MFKTKNQLNLVLPSKERSQNSEKLQMSKQKKNDLLEI